MNKKIKTIAVWFTLVVLVVCRFYVCLYLIGLWHIIDFSKPRIDFTQYPDDTAFWTFILIYSYDINFFVLIYFLVLLLVKWSKEKTVEKMDIIAICLAVITVWLMCGKYGYRLILE